MKTAPSSSFALYLSRFREFSPYERESKTVLDSRFHAVDSAVPGTGFQSLSMELGFWILIISGIPDSLSCIPDSKAQHFHFHKQNFPDPLNPDSITCLGSDRANIQITAYSFLGSWSWLPVLVSSQLDCVKKTGTLVAFTSKNVYWLSSVPCTPYRRPLISLLTPHMICFCVRSHLAHMPC